MLNTPWETGSDLYRRLVVSALVTTGLGVLIAVIGAITNQTALVFTGIPVIVAGMVCHLAGLAVRSRDTRRRLRETR
ncbi:hypothetical protein [Arthrobacter sp. TMS1-12-1]